ncbi:glycosyltransferase family 2 protein [Marinicella rhabdoformis]|uniref:glycosyltransferase family 2 protein n=1 Tax=Marinicella rhabdoformis TaxID=2580566 RepID=UPI0012AEC9F7|nr:glycosyltransferase family 2 protein [Marinicella rhabdoformis]
MNKGGRVLDKLSIVIPCLNEEKNLAELHDELIGINNGKIEIIYIDDGSKDKTWEVIEELIENSSVQVKGIRFTKNFGKEAAIESGFNVCTGDAVVTLDADLQHPVDTIPKMIEFWKNNKDVYIINALKETRQTEPFIKSALIHLYYKVFSFSCGMNLKNHTDFKFLDICVVKQYINLPEKNKFYRGLVNWLGYNSMNINIKINERPGNKTSWGNLQLIKYAKNTILSFSDLPLKSITWLGLFLFFFSLVMTIDTLVKKINGSSAEGFPTVILLILGIGSVIIFSLGLIGEYLAEIFNEIKARPRFVLSNKKESDYKDKQ